MLDRGMSCSEHSSKGSPLKYISPASFLVPNIFRANSTWVEHAPFAFWLVEASRPKIIVALGCNLGASFFVLCQAVQSSNLNARCYGIDNWENVDQDGFCGEDLFARVSAYNEQHYSSFSRVISSNFDDALVSFEERSIDLLYISADTYQQGKSCYERWRSRMSENGIVLLNNINDREREFGVWKLWEELERDHRSFSFFHGGGLGLIGLGCRVPVGVNGLLRTSDSDTAGKIRLIYSRIGGAIKDRIANEQLVARTHQMEFENARIGNKLSEAQLGLAQHVRRENYLSAEVVVLKAEQEKLSSAVANVTRELERSTEDKGALETRVAKLQLEIAQESERSRELELKLSGSLREHAAMLTISQQLAEDKGALETRVAKLQLEIAQESERSRELELKLSGSLREHATMLRISQQLAEDKASVERRLAKLEIELLATREVSFIQSERLSSRSFNFLERVHRRLTALGISPRFVSNCVFWLLRTK